MVDAPEGSGAPAPDPAKDGETDDEKAARLEQERATNKAEAQVKGWVKEAITEATPSLLETIRKNLPGSPGAASATSPNRRRSIFETITGR